MMQKKTKKTSLTHVNEIQMTCKEHCHTTDTIVTLGNSKLNCMRQ